MEELENVTNKSRKEIEEILKNTLCGAPKIILELHYGLNGNKRYTFKEISDELNIPMEKIRKIELEAIKYLTGRTNDTFLLYSMFNLF